MMSPGLRTKLALRMKRRKTVSVTPAIGARMVAGAMRTLPIWRDSGALAPCGTVVVLAGLSQNFFMHSLLYPEAEPFSLSRSGARDTYGLTRFSGLHHYGPKILETI